MESIPKFHKSLKIPAPFSMLCSRNIFHIFNREVATIIVWRRFFGGKHSFYSLKKSYCKPSTYILRISLIFILLSPYGTGCAVVDNGNKYPQPII
jgi:hypothetical protein